MLIHNVPVEKKARYERRPFNHAVVRITFNKTEDDEYITAFERTFHEISRRSDITAEWVQEQVEKMQENLRQRGDIHEDTHTLRSVDVTAVERVWSTPYEHLYPTE